MDAAKTRFVSYWQHFFQNVWIAPLGKILASAGKGCFWQISLKTCPTKRQACFGGRATEGFTFAV
jgi:hypothetical protein